MILPRPYESGSPVMIPELRAAVAGQVTERAVQRFHRLLAVGQARTLRRQPGDARLRVID